MPYRTPELSTYLSHLIQSYRRWTGHNLIAPGSQQQAIDALYHAPLAVVSHNTLPDPVFCYANLTAQRLWEMDWDAFTQLPSRLSAEADAREERQRLLDTAERQGYVDDYSGVRVTSTGKRFRIGGCILWNVVDENGSKLGQAAAFDHWEWL